MYESPDLFGINSQNLDGGFIRMWSVFWKAFTHTEHGVEEVNISKPIWTCDRNVNLLKILHIQGQLKKENCSWTAETRCSSHCFFQKKSSCQNSLKKKQTTRKTEENSIQLSKLAGDEAVWRVSVRRRDGRAKSLPNSFSDRPLPPRRYKAFAQCECKNICSCVCIQNRPLQVGCIVDLKILNDALPTTKNKDYREWWVDKDLETNNRGLFQGGNPVFSSNRKRLEDDEDEVRTHYFPNKA
jgi:hypothetical protein